MIHQEPYTCPICSAEKTSSFVKKNAFDYYRCHTCKSLFLRPLPTTGQLQDFYSTGYYENCKVGSGLNDKINTYADLADSVALDSAGEAVLEVGAGTGFFMSLLADRGVDIFGIEFSEASLAENPFTSRGKMFTSLDRLPPGRTFSAVVYLDVIEHIMNPEQHLRELAPYLAPEARIIMITPDRSSFSAKLLGRRWAHLSAPEHIHLFTPHGLSTLCERAGYSWQQSTPFKKNISIAYAQAILQRYSKLHVDTWMLSILEKILPQKVLDKPWRVCTGQMQAVLAFPKKEL